MATGCSVRKALRATTLSAILLAAFTIGFELKVLGQTVNNRQAALQVAFELASDFDSGPEQQRVKLLAFIDERGSVSDQEIVFAHAAFKAPPDSKYHALAPAQAAEIYAYIRALRSSYARFQAAQMDGNNDWASKQLKAAQEYAAILAKSLAAEAQQDDHDVAKLRQMPFAVRRSPAEQATFLENLKNRGLTSEHRKLMRESGRTETEIAAFEQQLLQLPPDKVGFAPDEFLAQIAARRRELATELEAFSRANSGALAGVSVQTFLVGNPHDKEETVDLFIRPVSIPSDWKLSVGDAEEQPKFKIREIDPGKHYAVTLPGKAQVKVASVVVPVGEVGTNTTARWAVEGKIGNELVGGMMNEMNAPYAIADLKLPPVGSQEVEEELSSPPKAWARIAAELGTAIVILALLVYLFISRRKRQRTGTSSSV